MYIPMLLLGHGSEGGLHFELPPLHPILVNFTAALVPASLVADLFGWWRGSASLRHAGWWMLFFASTVTPLTAVTGVLWLRQQQGDGGGDHGATMTAHLWLGIAVTMLLTAVTFFRGRMHLDDRRPGVPYLGAAAVLVAAVVVQGHLGGTMSFGGSGGTGAGHADPATSEGGRAPAPRGGCGHEHGGTGGAAPAGDGWSDHVRVK